MFLVALRLSHPPGYSAGETSYFLLIFKSCLNNLSVEQCPDSAYSRLSIILVLESLKILIFMTR